MKRFLRPRTLVPALGLLAGLLGTAAPAQAQVNLSLQYAGASSVAEGNAGTTTLTFNVYVNNQGAATPAAPAAVRFFTSNGTATAGGSSATGANDYVARDILVDIPALAADDAAPDGPDEAVVPVQVTINGDTNFEPDETFAANIQDPAGGPTFTLFTTSLDGTITNDDSQPTLSINDVTLAEGSNGGTTNFVFTVTPSNLSYQTINVDALTLIGSATSSPSSPGNPDFSEVNTTLTLNPFAANTTVTVLVNRDNTFEADENFLVRIEDATNATVSGDNLGTGTITNDDAAPTLSINDVTVCEDDGTATFTVTQSAISGLTTTVNVNSASGSATEGGDFQSVDGSSLTFAPGETVKTVTVVINDDGFADDLSFPFDSETFTVSLSGAVNATLADGTGVGTILDDEGLVVEIDQLSGDNYIGINGQPEQCFRVTVTNQCGDEVGAGQEVVVTIEGTTGSDRQLYLYTNGEGEVEFCYTPLFDGEDLITVEVLGAGSSTVVGSDSEEVRIFLPGNTDARVEGSGYVDTQGYGAAFFSLNGTVKRNGRAQGSVQATVPFPVGGILSSAAGPGLGAAAGTFRSTRLTTIIAGDAQPSGGHVAILFGTGKLFIGKRGFPVRYRVDVLDNGGGSVNDHETGVPTDRFVLTVLPLTPIFPAGNGGVIIGDGAAYSVGGALKHARGKGIKNDITVDGPGFGGYYGPDIRDRRR